jgi:hypothetical protein
VAGTSHRLLPIYTPENLSAAPEPDRSGARAGRPYESSHLIQPALRARR